MKKAGKREIKAYAQQILKEHGCTENSYYGISGEEIISDLKDAYPDGMKYPYVDVANAILSVSKPEKIVRAPYRMIFDIGHTVDGLDFDSQEAAKNDALDTLAEWMCQFTVENGISKVYPYEWTEKQQEDWDYMIYNFSVCVAKYDPETDEYITCWSPSAEDERSVGWMTVEEYRKNCCGGKTEKK